MPQNTSSPDPESDVTASEALPLEEIEASSDGVDEDVVDAEYTDEDKPKRERKSVGFKTATLMSLIAALAGGALGWIGPKLFDPANAAPSDAILRNAAAMKTLDQSQSAQAGTISRLQNDLRDVQANIDQLSTLRARLSGLEAAEQARASIDVSAERETALRPLEERLGVLEALLSSEDAPEGNPSILLERLEALDGEIAGLRTAAVTAQNPVIVKYSENEDSAPNTIEEAADQYDLVANFPRGQMLEVISTQRANSENPSWLRRMLSKHITVRDTGDQDAIKSIDAALALTKAGDISGAVDMIETLNPSLKAAAHLWLLEAKKRL